MGPPAWDLHLNSTGPQRPQAAVVDSLAKVGKMPVEQAEATVTDWQIKGKYNVEVW